MGNLESFCIGVVGDFSGRGAGGGGASASGQPQLREIDRDRFDRVLATISPEVRPGLPFCRQVGFERWRDFHPDGLVQRCPQLASLLEAREAVADPALARRHLAEAGLERDVLSSPRPASRRAGEVEASTRSPTDVDGNEILESMLSDAGAGGRESARERRGVSPASGFVDRAIREIVEGTADPTDYEQRDRWRASIDAELGERVRQILWHEDFRRLEASWRSLRELVCATSTGERLRIYVADFGQPALRAEIERQTRLEESSLFRLGADHAAGHEPLDLWLTDYGFDASEPSQAELAYLADLAERTGTRILAAARGSASAVQDASEQELAGWNRLQQRPGARRIGLCAPRLLLRPPYGERTDPAESFGFEEVSRVDRPGDHLWGGAAFAVARAAARAVAEFGGLAGIERCLDLEDLPLHVDQLDGEPRVAGPVEEALTETRQEAWSLMGLIPIAGIRSSDRARILSLRSLARTPLF